MIQKNEGEALMARLDGILSKMAELEVEAHEVRGEFNGNFDNAGLDSLVFGHMTQLKDALRSAGSKTLDTIIAAKTCLAADNPELPKLPF